MKVLAEGPRVLREEALRQAGRSGGVRGPEVYAKVQELHGAGLVPESVLPGALRRTGGNKAKPVLLDEGVKLPWLSASLLGKHLETADGARLRRGVTAVRARPALAKGALAGLERGVSSPDGETRRAAAQAVKKAVAARSLDAAKGESLLAGRVESETEPVLKAELTGSLEHIRGLKGPETGTQ